MNQKDYLKTYIVQSKIEQLKPDNPKWIKSFFKDFSEELERRIIERSTGDRNLVTGSFSKAFNNLIPEAQLEKEVQWEKEVQFKELVELGDDSELDKMLKKKRIDYVIYCKEKTVLIEFKTNLQFNDLSAAMIEMGVIKKYNTKSKIKSIVTSSLHLFPNNVNITGLKELNKKFGSPLDNIWVFCKGPELIFDIPEIIKFRNELINHL